MKYASLRCYIFLMKAMLLVSCICLGAAVVPAWVTAGAGILVGMAFSKSF